MLEPVRRSERIPRRRWPARLAWAFLAIVYLVVAVAWLWEYDLERSSSAYDTAALTTFLVRVLGVNIGIGGLVVLLVALVLRRWRYAVACIPVIAFLLWPVHDGLGTDGDLPEPRAGEVTIMSVNLRKGVDGADALLERVADVEPDILILQEYTHTWHERLDAELRGALPHVQAVPRADPQGIATFSSIEPLEERDIQLGAYRYPALRSAFEVGGRQLSLYNVHLSWPLTRSSHAEQRAQVARLVELLREEETPVIVMGDLNFTETTQHFSELRDAGMRSAWDELRSGRGITWTRLGRVQGRVPGLRLDHLLGSEQVEFGGIARGERGESDHWPLVATVGVSRRTANAAGDRTGDR